MGRAARERSWWSEYRDIASRPVLQVIEYEAAAIISRNFQPQVVPGLLQTEEYARAVLGQLNSQSSRERVDSLVAHPDAPPGAAGPGRPAAAVLHHG